MVVGITDAGEHRIVAHGWAGVGDDRTVGADTLFEIGSITKLFTAGSRRDDRRRDRQDR